jgi:hypothetical protein
MKNSGPEIPENVDWCAQDYKLAILARLWFCGPIIWPKTTLGRGSLPRGPRLTFFQEQLLIHLLNLKA